MSMMVLKSRLDTAEERFSELVSAAVIGYNEVTGKRVLNST